MTTMMNLLPSPTSNLDLGEEYLPIFQDSKAHSSKTVRGHPRGLSPGPLILPWRSGGPRACP